ncbi:MAG: hypothetical protein QF535_07260 [Anaerolineales bacterium]|nr:hypothetical protein [Anaerolineales bacterium]
MMHTKKYQETETDNEEATKNKSSLAKYVASYIREESEAGTFEIIDEYDNLIEVITNAINTYKGDAQ